jgi:hypothetical protein
MTDTERARKLYRDLGLVQPTLEKDFITDAALEKATIECHNKRRALILAELQAERDRAIEDVRMAFVANNWRGEGGWLPFVNKVLNTLKPKERKDADAE